MATFQPNESEEPRIVVRPDGFYWLADDGRREVGPFATAADAMADMRSTGENDLEPEQTREQAEAARGQAEAIAMNLEARGGER